MTWHDDFTLNIDRNEMKLHEILHIMKKCGCTKCDKMMEILIKMPGLHKVENTTCGCENWKTGLLNSLVTVTSSAINKKLEIDKKLENKLENYKKLEIKLEIYKKSRK